LVYWKSKNQKQYFRERFDNFGIPILMEEEEQANGHQEFQGNSRSIH
jgi:hypothetical protein